MTTTFDKYGVDTSPAEAKPGARCPVCNTPLRLTSPPTCRMCGTAPFESDPPPRPSTPGDAR